MIKVISKFILQQSLLLALISAIKLQAAEDSVYDFLWLDPDKAVYVLQNKTYRKEKTFSAGGSLLTTVGNEFQDTYGLDLKVDYFFTEVYGMEVFHSRYWNSDSDNFKNVVYVSQQDSTPNETIYPFVRRLTSATGVNFLWSPFYGKVNTFNRIFYFDWGFGLGLASLQTESNIKTVTTPTLPNSYTNESFMALSYKTYLKFHVDKKHYVSFEIRNFNYQAAGPQNPNSKQLRNNWDLLFGFSRKF